MSRKSGTGTGLQGQAGRGRGLQSGPGWSLCLVTYRRPGNASRAPMGMWWVEPDGFSLAAFRPPFFLSHPPRVYHMLGRRLKSGKVETREAGKAPLRTWQLSCRGGGIHDGGESISKGWCKVLRQEPGRCLHVWGSGAPAGRGNKDLGRCLLQPCLPPVDPGEGRGG